MAFFGLYDLDLDHDEDDDDDDGVGHSYITLLYVNICSFYLHKYINVSLLPPPPPLPHFPFRVIF